MASQTHSGNHHQPYLSQIAKNSFMSSQRKTPSGSPSKLDQDNKANTNSTLEHSAKNIAKADRLMDSPSKVAHRNEDPSNQQDVQLLSKRQSPERRSIKKTQSHCILDEEGFNQTKGKLFNANFNHHDPEMCVCSTCECGRHLCKLHVVKPEMHINTIYRNDFDNKKPIGPLSYRPRSSKRPDGPHIDMKSMYGKEFVPKGSELDRPHPEDLLGVGGPCAKVTTYGSGFPGHKGDNQYVKPTNNTSLNGLLPFTGSSVYNNSYVPKRGRSSDPYRLNDTLKVGSTWFGNTTYRESFRQPMEGYNTRFNPESHKDDSPPYSHQYQTTYKNDFLNKASRLCPAKVQLQTRTKGLFNDSKANFAENTDFKSMNPQFHAISTSKHSYV